MITELKIENYKSIQDLTLEVGRVNVLIGENGCGKSNILEAITFAAAAEANKLDNEFLASRGIRVTEPQLMRSAFDQLTTTQDIKVTIDAVLHTLRHDNQQYSEWEYLEKQQSVQQAELLTKQLLQQLGQTLEQLTEQAFNQVLERHLEQLKTTNEGEKIIGRGLLKAKLSSQYEEAKQLIKHYSEQQIEQQVAKIVKNELIRFVIYAPENTSLRNLKKEGQIQPLGIYGEGLFKLLTVIQNEAEQLQDFSQLEDIQETLELFGWFNTIAIPNNHVQLEQKLTIQDRFLATTFDQRSANEGFLLVLFYITLVVSKYTPKIFAIDNFDTSLNPKLCTKLIKELTRLAKKYDKQMFVTTHNPAILDGIDLGDDEQRLFVVSRNKQGHTRCKRIEVKDKPKSSVRDMLSRLFHDNKTYTKEEVLNIFNNDDDPLDISYAFSKVFHENETYSKDDILNKFDNSEEPVKLSYAFLRGYLGGLPKNF